MILIYKHEISVDISHQKWSMITFDNLPQKEITKTKHLKVFMK